MRSLLIVCLCTAPLSGARITLSGTTAYSFHDIQVDCEQTQTWDDQTLTFHGATSDCTASGEWEALSHGGNSLTYRVLDWSAIQPGARGGGTIIQEDPVTLSDGTIILSASITDPFVPPITVEQTIVGPSGTTVEAVESTSVSYRQESVTLYSIIEPDGTWKTGGSSARNEGAGMIWLPPVSLPGVNTQQYFYEPRFPIVPEPTLPCGWLLAALVFTRRRS